MKAQFIYENEENLFICEECGKQYLHILNFVMHVSRTHNTKEYYDKWIKTENENKCKQCGNPTQFISITKGYTNFCCKEHRIKYSHQKQKENNIKKYGVEYTFQRKDVIKKAKETNYKNHNGVFSSSDPDVIKKSKETRKEKYGDENYVNSNKSKQTRKEKYGDENYTNREKAGKTNLKKFGNISPLHGEEQVKKKKETWNKNYGVDSPLQNRNIFDKAFKTRIKIKQYKDTNLTYQASYEYDFLEKYYDKIDIVNGLSIKYTTHTGAKKVYHSDFFIPSLNLVIEIKNKYLYDTYKEEINTKEYYTKLQGYNYILILEKNYSEFEKIIYGNTD